MKQNKATQILSTTLSLALAVTSAPWPANAAPMGPAAPSFVSRLTPPEQFGYVASSYSPNADESRPRLIVIADLHGHEEVQSNITGMLEHFINALSSSKGGQPQSSVPVFVEGGLTSGLEKPLAGQKDLKTRRLVAEYLGRKSELHPAQLYTERHVDSNVVRVIGVEDKELYEINGERFKQSYPSRKVLLEAIARHEDALQQLRQTIEPAAVTKLHDLREKYHKGMVSSAKYASVLYRQAKRLGISNQWVDFLKTPNQTSMGDLEVSLTTVHRQVSVRLADSKPLSAYFRKELDKEDVIRRSVAHADSLLDLLKRLVGDQLTPDEVPLAMGQLPQLVRVAEVLIGKEELGIDIQKTLIEALDFYPYAIARDKVLLDNSLAALAKDPSHAPTGILVVGGFHTGAMADQLRKSNIPYMVVNPNITRDITADEQLGYLKRTFGEHITADEMIDDLSRNPSGLNREALAAPAVTPVSNRRDGVPDDGAAHARGFTVLGLADRVATVEGVTRVKGDVYFGENGSAESIAAQIAVRRGWLANIMNRMLGYVMPHARRLQADIDARTRAVASALAYNPELGQGNFELNIDPTMGSTLQLKGDGTFEVQGVAGNAGVAQAQAYFANVAAQGYHTTPSGLNKIHFQGVNGRIFERLRDAEGVEKLDEGDDMVVVRFLGSEPVVFFNTDKAVTKQEWDGIRGKIQEGADLTPAEQNVMTHGILKFHELMHILTVEGRKGKYGEAQTQVNALAVAANAMLEGLESAPGLGADAIGRPTAKFVLANFFRNLPPAMISVEVGENTEARQRGKLEEIVNALSDAPGVMSVSELRDFLGNIIHPAALDAPAVKALADSIRTELNVDESDVSDFNVESALNQIAGDLTRRAILVNDKATRDEVERIIRQMLYAANATKRNA